MKSKNIKKIYIRNLKKKLNTPSDSSKQFIHMLEQNIDNYLIKNSNATYSNLETNFGSIDTIANSYFESLDYDELPNHFSYKKRTYIVTIIIFFCLCITCSGIYAWYHHNLNKDVPTYSVEEIEEIN